LGEAPKMVEIPQSDHIVVPDAHPNPKDFWRIFGFSPEGMVCRHVAMEAQPNMRGRS
jgi:hypothetical protein